MSTMNEKSFREAIEEKMKTSAFVDGYSPECPLNKYRTLVMTDKIGTIGFIEGRYVNEVQEVPDQEGGVM